MKIQLVQAMAESPALAKDRWLAPLGLISIGTYLEKYSPDTEVEILDGVHLGLVQILKKLSADIIGLSFNIFSTRELDLIAEASKQKKALVVVGGQAATPLSRQLLNKNPNIDVVVRYDGEEALRQIAERVKAQGKDFSGIPNIAYRKSGEIVQERVEFLDFPALPIPNRGIGRLNLEEYIASFGGSTLRPTNAHTRKGCTRLCSFCGRIDKSIRTRTPGQVYEEDRFLADKFKVNYVFETSDTFFIDKEWLRNLRDVYQERGKLPLKYSTFCDIRDINSETVETMKYLGVDTIVVGIESGSEKIRRESGKLFNNQKVLEAAKLLGNADITLQDSYVLGLPGETEETVEETRALSRKVAENCKTFNRGFSVIIPLPGSPIWGKMMQVPELKKKYGDEYAFNVEELRADYLRHFCLDL